ncbi:MAG: hypothetical protein ACRDQA_26245 [Nocardioidaceae bacterium]
MTNPIPPAAKAWVALIGSVVTGLLGLSVIPVDGSVRVVLTIVAMVCTTLVTFAVPNKPAASGQHQADAGEAT